MVRFLRLMVSANPRSFRARHRASCSGCLLLHRVACAAHDTGKVMVVVRQGVRSENVSQLCEFGATTIKMLNVCVCVRFVCLFVCLFLWRNECCLSFDEEETLTASP